jgi:hypothetical protein
MWSGPRNISTALMRSFAGRGDTAVIDEPFYAAYLARTGLMHPLRDAVLAAQPHDPSEVVRTLLGPVPEGKAVFYQKHMAQHILAGDPCDWLAQVTSAFLIRAPEPVLASYAQKRDAVALSDLGFVQQRALFEREAERLGTAPPVIDSADVLVDPGGTLRALCAALGISYTEAMLTWPAGAQPSDGAWAPAWYAAVERSTGFLPSAPRSVPPLPGALARIAEQARPHYEALARHRLRSTT